MSPVTDLRDPNQQRRMIERSCLFCDDTLRLQYYTPETQVCDSCAHELAAHVLDACVVNWVTTDGKKPKELLSALLLQEQKIALDPLVSEVAADWKRRADMGDAAVALRDQEVALSGRLRERAEKAEERLWAARENLKRAVGVLQEVKRSGLPDESIDPRFHLGSQVWVVCDDIEKSLKGDP